MTKFLAKFCFAIALFVSMLACNSAYATAWTTTGPGTVSSLSNWTNGTAAPTTFATPGDTWTIAHAMTITSSGSWIVGTAAAAPVSVSIAASGTFSVIGTSVIATSTVHGNFAINGGTLNVSGGAGTTHNLTINGNMNVGTGGMNSTGTGTVLNLTVNGNYTQTGGGSTVSSSSAKLILNNHGNFTMTAGAFSATGLTSQVLLNLYGNCSFSGPSVMTCSGSSATSSVHLMLPSASGTMLINNTSTGGWTNTNIYLDAGCTAQLNGNFRTTTGGPANGLEVNGTLICPAAYTVNGAGLFTLYAIGTLKVAHATGINGAITSTSHSLGIGAKYEYNGTVPQVTGTLLPTWITSTSLITINNSAGVTLSAAVYSTGTLAFSAGILHTAAYDIHVPATPGGLTGAGATSYVHGTLIKPVTGVTSINYEVGDLNYAPVSVLLDVPGTGGVIGAKSTNGLHPNVATSGLAVTNMANHYWTITNYTISGPTTVTPTVTYNASDIIGGSNTFFVTKKYTAAAWTPAALPTTNTTAPYTSKPTSGIAAASLTGDYIFGNLNCGTAPITGTPTVCVAATTPLANVTPGGTWSSGTPAVATVDAAGLVSGVMAGTTIISYTAAGCSSMMVVTVLPLADPGTVTGVSTACIGLTSTLSSTVPSGTWSSTTPAVGTISASGVLTGIAAGTTIISYTVSNTCGTVAATVVATISTTPTVDPITGPDTVCVGNTISLSCATGGGSWSNFNTALATVTGGGIVTGGAPGTDTIYYTVTNSCGTALSKKTVEVKPAGFCATGIPLITVGVPANVHVFPNPSTGTFTLSLGRTTGDAQITISDITGRIVTEFTMLTGTQKEIKLHQPPGLYIISATTSTERHFVKVHIE